MNIIDILLLMPPFTGQAEVAGMRSEAAMGSTPGKSAQGSTIKGSAQGYQRTSVVKSGKN